MFGRKWSIFLGLLFIPFFAACTTPTETALPSASPETATPPSATLTTLATITPLATRVTPTAALPLSAGEDWLTYQNEALAIKLSYPPDWEIQSTPEIRGEGGFIRLEPFSAQGMTMDAFCQLTVNEGIPHLYGEFPQIEQAYSGGMLGCLVIPANDSPPTAFLWQLEDPTLTIQATGTEEYLRPILLSATALLPPTQFNPNSSVSKPCRLNEDPPQVYEEGGLRFEQYRLTSAACHKTMDVESFASLLPPEAQMKTDALLEMTPPYIQTVNQALAPFDYQFKEGSLYHQGKAVPPYTIQRLEQPVVNAAQTEFYLPVFGSAYGIPQLVTASGVEKIPYYFHSVLNYVPSMVFIGNDLISVTLDEDHPTEAGELGHLQVRRNDEVVFRFTTLPFGPFGGPMRGLWQEGDSWLLELADVFIRDGEILNKTYSYEAMFTYRQIKEQPFYFYQQDGQIFISYAGQTLSQPYQQVIHKPACCSAGMVNMTFGYEGLAFYGLQDGFWVYTIITPKIV